MEEIVLDQEIKDKVQEFYEALLLGIAEQLGIDEIIAGCEVLSLDPLGVGAGVFPRQVLVDIMGNELLALWRGGPSFVAGDDVSVVHMREGNRYEIIGMSGSTGVEFDADAYLWVWVYDVTGGVLIPYTTIAGALGYAALASGDYVLIPPGTFNEAVTLVDGVIITEQIPGTVILHRTSGSTCVTCADGGYIQVKEIQCTRGAGQSPIAVDASGLGANETSEIHTELIKATHTGTTGAEQVFGLMGGGSGIVTVYSDWIEVDFTENGGGDGGSCVYCNGDTFYIHSDTRVTYDSDGSGSCVENVFMEGGTIYFWGYHTFSGDGGATGYNYFIADSGATFYQWGDADIEITGAGSIAYTLFHTNGASWIFGNLHAKAVALAAANYSEADTVHVRGRCYAETTGNTGAEQTYGFISTGATAELHGDGIAVGVNGVRYGVYCAGTATMTQYNGVTSGATYDILRVAGTMRVSMVDFDSYSGTITQYYPMVDDAWIGLAGGAGARITFDDQATDFVNFVSCHVGINETTPGGMGHITIDGAAVVGLIIEGALNQAADLQQWKNNAGNIVTSLNTNATRTEFLIESPGTTDFPSLVFECHATVAATTAQFFSRKDRGGAALQGNDVIFAITAQGYTGAAYANSAAIYFKAQGNHGVGSTPGNIFFLTTPNGSTVAANRMIIGRDGNVGINDNVLAAQVTIIGDDINDVVLVVRGVASQASNLFQCQDSGSNVGFAVEADFDVVIGSGAAGKDYTLTFNGETNDGVMTWMEDEAWFEFSDWLRADAADYRRYYHLRAESFDPGASGATWVDPDGNTVGGWEITASSHDLQATVDVHSDWDGASDLTVEVRFEIAVAGGGPGDVVEFDLDVYYKGVGETVTKSQSLNDIVTVDASAQWTMFEASFTINYNALGNVVEAGDIVKLVLTLDTASSDVDDVIINNATFYYNTTHVGIESGDT